MAPVIWTISTKNNKYHLDHLGRILKIFQYCLELENIVTGNRMEFENKNTNNANYNNYWLNRRLIRVDPKLKNDLRTTARNQSFLAKS